MRSSLAVVIVALAVGLGSGGAASAADDPRVLETQALKPYPDDVDRLLRVAQLEAEDGDVASAERRLRRAHQLAPHYVDVTLQLARVLAWQSEAPSDYDEALQLAAAVAEKHPEMAEAHGLLGDIARWSGNPLDAVGHYQRAIERTPDGDATRSELHYRRLLAIQETGDDEALAIALAALPEIHDDPQRAALRSALRARQSRTRLDVAYTHTFVDTGDWSQLTLGVTREVHARVATGVRFAWDRRHYEPRRFDDFTIMVPIYVDLSDRITLMAEGGGAPRADVVARGRAMLGMTHTVHRLLSYGLDYRFARYVGVDTHTVVPSLLIHAGPLRLKPALYITRTTVPQTTVTAALGVEADIRQRGRLSVTTMFGTEPSEPSAAVLRDPPQQFGLVATVSQRLAPLTELRFSYTLWTPLQPSDTTLRTRHGMTLHWVQHLPGRRQR